MNKDRFSRYSRYKPSDLEWLGQIPAHWEIRRLKLIATVTPSNVDKHSLEGEGQIRLCNYVDVYYNDHVTGNLDLMVATASPEEERKFWLRAGDVLITKDSESWDDIAVSAFVPTNLSDVLCGYHLAVVRPELRVVDGAYLFRAFSARGVNDQFRVAANGITRFALGQDAIGTALFPLPPLEEQHTIATFLDRETTNIDAHIAKKGRLLALLEEKRTALITRAVTKGLDPAVPMKESGVEWLGEVPASWLIARLKFLCTRAPDAIQIGPFGSMLKDVSYVGGPYKVYGQENVISGDFTAGNRWITSAQWAELSRYQARGGDLLFTRKGSLGNCSLFPDDAQRGIIDSDTIRVRLDQGVLDRRFLVRLLHEETYANEQMMSGRRGAVLGGLNSESIADLLLAVPPLEEQVRIATWIQTHTHRIDELTGTVRAAISLLKEYRTALISAAVTGQIDVSAAAGPTG